MQIPTVKRLEKEPAKYNLPFLCRALALEIQRDLSIDTEVNASYDFCVTQTKHNML